MDNTDVVAEASHGFVKALADELDVHLARMYELLSKDNPYPKLWRILRPLGRFNPEGLRLIRADFNARCEALLSTSSPVTGAQLHKELSEAVQSSLAKLPVADQRRELTEARMIIDSRLAELSTVN